MKKINNHFLLLLVLFFLSSSTTMLSEDIQETGSEEKNKTFTVEESHRFFAVQLNNYVWNLLSVEDRSKEDDQMMIHAAHSSLFHWIIVGTDLNAQRGEWLISRVYAVLNRPEPALYHAKQCLDYTEKNKYIDFDLAYAYEAMARAYAASGNEEKTLKYRRLAKDAGNEIEDPQNQKLFFSDFNTEPWFGLNR